MEIDSVEPALSDDTPPETALNLMTGRSAAVADISYGKPRDGLLRRSWRSSDGENSGGR
jgi:hypothetical protein